MPKFTAMGCLVTVLLCLSGPRAFATISESTESGTIQLSYRVMHVSYDEPGVMNETGWFHGAALSYENRLDRIWFGLEGELFGGDLDYDGKYSDGTPVKGDTDDYLFQARGLLGYDLIQGEWYLTPFAGIAYRYWNDKLQLVGGYEREINYLYMPFGFKLTSQTQSFRFGLNAEYDLFLAGLVKSHLSDAGEKYSDAENKQRFGTGHGCRLSLFLEYDLSDTVVLGVEPFFRYWKVQDSAKDEILFGGKTGLVGMCQ